MGPNCREASLGREDILIDITVPAGRDTQTCGLRVLQYLAIIGNAFATRPEVLREGEEVLQKIIKEIVFPQIQQVNSETTETYHNEMRLHLQQTEWGGRYARIQPGQIYSPFHTSANLQRKAGQRTTTLGMIR